MAYLHNTVEELNSGLPGTYPDSSRMEDLYQGPPHFKSSTLNHPAMLPPSCYPASYICIFLILRTWWQIQVPIQHKVAYEGRFLAFFSHHGKTLFGGEKQKPEICLYWFRRLVAFLKTLWQSCATFLVHVGIVSCLFTVQSNNRHSIRLSGN